MNDGYLFFLLDGVSSSLAICFPPFFGVGELGFDVSLLSDAVGAGAGVGALPPPPPQPTPKNTKNMTATVGTTVKVLKMLEVMEIGLTNLDVEVGRRVDSLMSKKSILSRRCATHAGDP